jgi:hypothetical protein
MSMKYENKSVLTPDKVEIGKSYLLGELPCGISFKLGSGIFSTVTYPKYNLVVRNCLQKRPAEVWNIQASKTHRVMYRQRVKVVGKA